MHFTLLLAALPALINASPVAHPQAVTERISASGSAPPGCSPTAEGTFGIFALNMKTFQVIPNTSLDQPTSTGDHAAAKVVETASPPETNRPRGKIETVEVQPIGDNHLSGAVIIETPAFSAAKVSEQSHATPESIAYQVKGTTINGLLPHQDSCKTDSTLVLTLADGVLRDRFGRTGYIALNRQFQFDSPPQAGALITAGFAMCNNGSLALGGTNVFWQCLSGDFYNLYDQNWAPQCSPITLNSVSLRGCN